MSRGQHQQANRHPKPGSRGSRLLSKLGAERVTLGRMEALMQPTEIALPPETQGQLARVQALATTPRAIASPAHERAAIDDLAFIQSVKRALEAARTDLVRPLNDRVKAINERIRTLAEPVARAEETIKAALLGWRQVETRRLEAERRAAERAAEARAAEEAERQATVDAELRASAAAAGFGEEAEASAPTARDFAPAPVAVFAPPAPVATVAGAVGTATLRKVWTFEVLDLDQVPRAYLLLDEPRVREAIRLGLRELPGLRIFEREEIAGGRAR
jgi:hypothetical protein